MAEKMLTNCILPVGTFGSYPTVLSDLIFLASSKIMSTQALIPFEGRNHYCLEYGLPQ